MTFLKIHSHPSGLEEFSTCDDSSDEDIFSSVFGWTGNDNPHVSAIMLPDGKIFGRVIKASGEFRPLKLVSVAGDDIHFWYSENNVTGVREFARRHAQAFGSGTTSMLERLSVAVIGCSGTGSPTIVQLARLGAGKFVLVDPDIVEEKNVNRILNATIEDALQKMLKVDVMKRAITNMGLGTKVQTFPHNLYDPKVVKAVANCDVIFGCMDSVDGRYLLNRLATFYSLPYFDMGVLLEADGHGGIDQICGTVNYLQPGGSSLLSRGVFTLEQVRAAGLKRTDPSAYREQLESKYIVGVREDRPAVISVNMLISSLAVNEFLARLHPYRDDDNKEFAAYRFSLTQAILYKEMEGEPCRLLLRHVGRGDVRPLLDLPELGETDIEIAA